MASSLDMSLDDRIKSSRSNRERGRGRGRARAHTSRGTVKNPGVGGRITGAARRGLNTRPSSYAIAKASSKTVDPYTYVLLDPLAKFGSTVQDFSLLPSFMSIRRTGPFPWQQDLFEDSLRAAGIQGVEVGTKLYVSNLDHGVTNEDIRELFSEIGDLKRCVVHYDKTGHPSGSAEVVYTRRSDAFAALKRYNNVLLDGKPMKIEIVGANAELPITARVNVSGVNGRRKKRTVVMMSRGGQTGGGAGLSRAATRVQRSGARPKGGTSSGRGRARGRGRGRVGRQGRGKKEKSAEELDKELETYHAEAMNIS
ncbi:hypothetical protein AHAS_Ahas17G0098100 [Arachis hypogaea]